MPGADERRVRRTCGYAAATSEEGNDADGKNHKPARSPMDADQSGIARAVFMGSPATAVSALKALAGHPACRVVGVFTPPDRPVGRSRRPQPCPVKTAALALKLPVFTPEKIRSAEALQQLGDLRPDIAVVCAYGQLFSQALLELPRLGCYNLHFSLLPRWRGASPVQAAILAGDAVTGVTFQRMVLELDAGPSAAETPPIPIRPDDTAETLSGRLAEAAAELLAATLPHLLKGLPPLREQDGAGVTRCRTLAKEAGAIHWEAETALEVERKVRAFTPWPGCFSFLGQRRLGIARVEIAAPPAAAAGEASAPGTLGAGGLVPAREGWVRLLEVKPEGKRAMSAAEFLNGMPGALGALLQPAPPAG